LSFLHAAGRFAIPFLFLSVQRPARAFCFFMRTTVAFKIPLFCFFPFLFQDTRRSELLPPPSFLAIGALGPSAVVSGAFSLFLQPVFQLEPFPTFFFPPPPPPPKRNEAGPFARQSTNAPIPLFPGEGGPLPVPLITRGKKTPSPPHGNNGRAPLFLHPGKRPFLLVRDGVEGLVE